MLKNPNLEVLVNLTAEILDILHVPIHRGGHFEKCHINLLITHWT